MLTTLYNLFRRWYNWNDFDMYSEEDIARMKENAENFVGIAKSFLDWLIKNWHIEVIESEKKAWPDLNDYIKYIAETEDPVKTLVGMLKIEKEEK